MLCSMDGSGKGKPVALSTTCQGECSSGGRPLTFKCGQKRPPGIGVGVGVAREYRVWSIEYRGSACLGVGAALRAALGCLVAAAGRPRVGVWLRRALRNGGHDKSCPYLGSPCGERFNHHPVSCLPLCSVICPTANRYPLTAGTLYLRPYFPIAALIDFTTALPRTA